MMSMEDLAAQMKAQAAANAAEDTDDEDDVEQAYVDMAAALEMLNRCMHLLDFMSDPVLCRAISKRERDSMARLSDQVKELLDELEPEYSELEEAE